jgi:rsbT co-antagonist protein RsbR
VDHGNQILTIEDLKESDLTKDLNVTHNLGGGSFIGIPLYYSSGENYGTICGLDAQPFEFTEEHRNIFWTMASLLSYVLDLDRVNKEVEELSAPMVSLTDGLAVLPIIGDINEKRAQTITQATLYNCTRLSLNYLIVDLSGMHRINKVVSRHLLDIVKMLRLIGVVPILTGIQPAHASQMTENNLVLNDVLVKNSLEAALSHIGFSLVNTNKI